MTTTTHYGWPKPNLTTDQPNGPAQIGALADAADTTLYAQLGALPVMQTGSLSVSVTTANTPTTTHVTFSPSFTGTPHVFLTSRATHPGIQGVACQSPATTGFDILYERTDGAGTITVDWLAVLTS